MLKPLTKSQINSQQKQAKMKVIQSQSYHQKSKQYHDLL